MRLWHALFVVLLLAPQAGLADVADPGEPVPADQRERTPAHLEWLAEHFAEARFQSYISPHFVILHDTDPWRARLHAELLERARAQFFDAFERAGFTLRPPAHRLVCLLFADETHFIRYARRVEGMDLSWTGGYYSARTNRVALFERGWPTDRPEAMADADESPADGPDAADARKRLAALEPAASDRHDHGPASTIHEAVHQLAFNTGLQRRGVMYPLWISEGLAIAFETHRPHRTFGAGRVNADRLVDLRRARDADRLLPLDRFVALTRPPTTGDITLAETYAQSWSLFHYLFASQPANLRQYMQNLAALAPGRRSMPTLRREFVAAFGPIDATHEAWQAHVDELLAAE